MAPLATPYRTHCSSHGALFLSHKEYIRQLDAPNAPWRCPLGCSAEWDDSWYENWAGRSQCLATECQGGRTLRYTPDGSEMSLCDGCPWPDYTEIDLDKEDLVLLLASLTTEKKEKSP